MQETELQIFAFYGGNQACNKDIQNKGDLRYSSYKDQDIQNKVRDCRYSSYKDQDIRNKDTLLIKVAIMKLSL